MDHTLHCMCRFECRAFAGLWKNEHQLHHDRPIHRMHYERVRQAHEEQWVQRVNIMGMIAGSGREIV